MDRTTKWMQAIDRKSSKNVMRQGNVPLNSILDNVFVRLKLDLIHIVCIFM